MKIFHLPDLGEGLAEAEIREWYVKAGDIVKVDQPLVSMETAKAVLDVPSPYSGKIFELHGKVNDIIKTGAAFISFDIDEAATDQGSVVGKLESSQQKWEEGDLIIGLAKAPTKTIKALPAARVLAQQMNIDLHQIKPSGREGLITVEDVKQFIQHPGCSTMLTGQTELLHGVRRVMAIAMKQSHQEIVPVTLCEDADISALKGSEAKDITVNMVQAIIAGVKIEPALNAWFDGKTLERKLFNEVHIGLAVDSAEGLFVPVIKHAEEKTKEALRQLIDTYKQAIHSRSIKAEEMQGASIILSNFGMIAGRYATPIVVPPMVAILACGRSREVPIVSQGEIKIGRLMPLSLTFDHRAVSGAEAARFMRAVIQHLEKKLPTFA
jgi:2-oxoisovalerate dehydrogenase E2 component (dihydrolipoyl transacylase)